MIERIVIAWLKARMDANAAKATPIGGTVHTKAVARGVRLFGHRWDLDVVARRTE